MSLCTARWTNVSPSPIPIGFKNIQEEPPFRLLIAEDVKILSTCKPSGYWSLKQGGHMRGYGSFLPTALVIVQVASAQSYQFASHYSTFSHQRLRGVILAYVLAWPLCVCVCGCGCIAVASLWLCFGLFTKSINERHISSLHRFANTFLFWQAF
jgi:hypothetical protein